ncbi:hypothetical protein [Lacihabitans soyangensis]|uniref:hypothetical protein n=1 Tax=Lacihabitans soyangensis TaxID=869394 RepID=UPI0020CCD9D7|nr:hypothetical protein [Lacihabitans soyangensis]
MILPLSQLKTLSKLIALKHEIYNSKIHHKATKKEQGNGNRKTLLPLGQSDVSAKSNSPTRG